MLRAESVNPRAPLVLQSSRSVVSGFPSPLLGINPDDTYNETPYEKGFCFVSYLAHLVGDQGKFDAFLQVGGGTARPCWGAWGKLGLGDVKCCGGRKEHGEPGRKG